MDYVTTLLFILVVMLPISLVVRLIAAVFSPQVRKSMVRHRTAHLVWLLGAIVVVCLLLWLSTRVKA